MPVNRIKPSSDEVKTQWLQIGQRVYRDIPALNIIWNPLVEATMGLSRHDRNPIELLETYIQSLFNTSGQILYAQERLHLFSINGTSNTYEFYVAYYLFDIVTRVKTTTDLLALIINQLYELNLPDKACSLENGSFAGKIRASNPDHIHLEQLARKIDRIRNGWLGTFDKLRDKVVHQAGIRLMGAGGAEHAIHIQIDLPKRILKGVPFAYNPQNPLEALKPFANDKDEDLLRFLSQIDSSSISEYLISVDPVKLCDEIWRLLSTTSDEFLKECSSDVLALISRKPS